MSTLPAFPQGNIFAVPSRAPGFDPNHIVASKTKFSAIGTSGGNMTNLLFGRRLLGVTGAASLTSKLLGGIGRAFNVPGGTNAFLTETAKTANVALDTTFTFGAIFQLDATGANFQTIAQTGDGSGGSIFLKNSATNELMYSRAAGTNFPSGILMAANVPYFAAVTVNTNSTVSNFTLVNLRTGQTSVATKSAQAPAAGGNQNQFVVGSIFNSTFSITGSIAALAYTSNYVGQTALNVWAKDPWSFWYPPSPQSFVGQQTQASVTAVWNTGTAIRQRIEMIGV